MLKFLATVKVGMLEEVTQHYYTNTPELHLGKQLTELYFQHALQSIPSIFDTVLAMVYLQL